MPLRAGRTIGIKLVAGIRNQRESECKISGRKIVAFIEFHHRSCQVIVALGREATPPRVRRRPIDAVTATIAHRADAQQVEQAAHLASVDFEVRCPGFVGVPPVVKLRCRNDRGRGVAPNVGDQQESGIGKVRGRQANGVVETTHIRMNDKVPWIAPRIGRQLRGPERHVIWAEGGQIRRPLLIFSQVGFHTLRDGLQTGAFGVTRRAIELINDIGQNDRHQNGHHRQDTDDFEEGEAGGTTCRVKRRS